MRHTLLLPAVSFLRSSVSLDLTSARGSVHTEDKTSTRILLRGWFLVDFKHNYHEERTSMIL